MQVNCYLFTAAVSLSLGVSQQDDGREQGEQKHLGNVESEEPKAAENNGPTHATNCVQKGSGKESHLPQKPPCGEQGGEGLARWASRSEHQGDAHPFDEGGDVAQSEGVHLSILPVLVGDEGVVGCHVLVLIQGDDALGLGDESRVCGELRVCLLYTSPSPRDRTRSRMPSSA